VFALASNDPLRYTKIASYGPVPVSWPARHRWEKLVAELEQTGSVVFDVSLKEIYDDDADPGYYDDAQLPPEVRAEVDATLEVLRSSLLK
jgi:hypothetical protein